MLKVLSQFSTVHFERRNAAGTKRKITYIERIEQTQRVSVQKDLGKTHNAKNYKNLSVVEEKGESRNSKGQAKPN